jgi:transposase InsO family protein
VREILILASHLLVTLAKLLLPGGVRAVAAESLLLKQQLLISNRCRQRAPNLTAVDRFLLAFASPQTRPKGSVRGTHRRHHRAEASQSALRLTFIAQATDSLWSVDLFRCESILLHSHWVLVVIDVFTRGIIGFGIERASSDGMSVCRMFNHAVTGRPLPKHVSTGVASVR